MVVREVKWDVGGWVEWGRELMIGGEGGRVYIVYTGHR